MSGIIRWKRRKFVEPLGQSPAGAGGGGRCFSPVCLWPCCCRPWWTPSMRRTASKVSPRGTSCLWSRRTTTRWSSTAWRTGQRASSTWSSVCGSTGCCGTVRLSAAATAAPSAGTATARPPTTASGSCATSSWELPAWRSAKQIFQCSTSHIQGGVYWKPSRKGSRTGTYSTLSSRWEGGVGERHGTVMKYGNLCHLVLKTRQIPQVSALPKVPVRNGGKQSIKVPADWFKLGVMVPCLLSRSVSMCHVSKRFPRNKPPILLSEGGLRSGFAYKTNKLTSINKLRLILWSLSGFCWGGGKKVIQGETFRTFL